MKESDKENQGQKTMSINFKNSLYKKMNATSVFLDDQSQLLQSKEGSSSNNIVRGGIRLRKDYFDTSSSSSSRSAASLEHLTTSQDHYQQQHRKPMNLSKHIKDRQMEVLGVKLLKDKRGTSQNVRK